MLDRHLNRGACLTPQYLGRYRSCLGLKGGVLVTGIDVKVHSTNP